MTVEHTIELARNALMLTLILGAPVMLIALAVGLVVSILQAVTQVQDQTLSFVPKIVAMLLALLVVLPWMMSRMIEYSTNLFHDIPSMM